MAVVFVIMIYSTNTNSSLIDMLKLVFNMYQYFYNSYINSY